MSHFIILRIKNILNETLQDNMMNEVVKYSCKPQHSYSILCSIERKRFLEYINLDK